MKSNIKIFTVLFLLMTSCLIVPGKATAQQTSVSFQVFYDELSPYGQWINYSDYGYVWIPDAESDFVPYSTDGHWILSDYGWTWASDYNWGWAVFHYGRWSYNDSFGWFWVPDNEWGPAWVNWRQADGYFGWSPMEPGMTLTMSLRGEYDNDTDYWMFVRDRDIERQDINQYYINQNDQDRIGRNSVVISNTYRDADRRMTYVSGPTRVQVQKVVGRNIVPVKINDSNKPGQAISNGQFRIYRPQVVKNNRDAKIVPSHVFNMNELKRTPSRNSSQQNQIGNPGNGTIRQPYNAATPQNNSSQPRQPRDANQLNNNQQNQQKNASFPSNPDSRNQSIQPKRTTPSPVKRTVTQPQVIAPLQNNQPVQRQRINQNNYTPQPAHQQNASPQNNTVQPNQPRNVKPQDNSQSPVLQRSVSPQINSTKPDQQRNGTPQNYNSQPGQQRNGSPQNNNKPADQPKTVTPQNNSQGQKTPAATIQNPSQPVQRQNNMQQNNRPAKQAKSIKQEVKKEQAKTPDAVTDKK